MKLLKKTLLATAVAVTCSTALAGTVSVTKQVHSSEGLTGVTANQTSNAISYTLAAAYQEGDRITFTFPDGALVANGFPAQVNVPAVNSATPANAIAGLALGLLNSDTNSVTYRVTSITQPTDGVNTTYTDRTTIGAVLPLGTIDYTADAVRNGSVTVTVSSVTAAGDTLDASGTRTATVAEAKTQFGTASVTAPFDAVVDVSQMRQAFVGGVADSMSWAITDVDTTGWLNVATVNATSGTVVNLYGEAGKMGNVTAAQWSSAGSRTFTADSARLSVAYGGMTTNDTITFTPLTGTSAAVIEAQAFTADFTYNYTSAGSQAGSATVGSGLSAGSWTLNGATVNIPYMPYGPTASQVVYVTNSGTQAGDISVTAFDNNGNTFDLGVIGTANAQTVTKLAPAINTALEAAGFAGSQASITVTVNAPEDDITVHASFNIGGNDRAFVITDQYKGVE
ncbi:hypothetical protein [Planctobacterium marinum]|uniref:Uncharacterized protein n=1 Tax=Planctobacterium marinum TaxID=1631968 RepID=A0AA48KTL8_9ALTE|nr:hypothetical protein MACH26_32040 [Planctobacterium marinum]BDX07684.1 hypothetical protein MACH26_32050 [Planctobacterium marinum]